MRSQFSVLCKKGAQYTWECGLRGSVCYSRVSVLSSHIPTADYLSSTRPPIQWSADYLLNSSYLHYSVWTKILIGVSKWAEIFPKREDNIKSYYEGVEHVSSTFEKGVHFNYYYNNPNLETSNRGAEFSSS